MRREHHVVDAEDFRSASDGVQAGIPVVAGPSKFAGGSIEPHPVLRSVQGRKHGTVAPEETSGVGVGPGDRSVGVEEAELHGNAGGASGAYSLQLLEDLWITQIDERALVVPPPHRLVLEPHLRLVRKPSLHRSAYELPNDVVPQ